jgi:hypothetical protein
MFFPPSYRCIDSTTTTAQGTFEFNFPKNGMVNAGQYMLTDMRDKKGFISQDVVIKSDTIITLYMTPREPSSILSTKSPESMRAATVFSGKNLIVSLPDWTDQNRPTVVVANASGAIVATLPINTNGTFIWNTSSVAKGLYLVKINATAISVMVH